MTYIFSICLLFISSISAYSHDFFYKNNSFKHDTLYDRDFLHSSDITITYGGSHKSKNGLHKEVPLLDVYGVQDLRYTFLNYATDPIRTPVALTTDLQVTIDEFLAAAQTDTTETIGKISCDGKFRYSTVEINCVQNFANGFFIQLYIPFSNISVRNITLNPVNSHNNGNVAQFYNQLPTILNAYNISLEKYDTSTISDVTLLGGWTSNSDSSEVFDFVDMSLQLGVSVPTSKAQNIAHAFAPANGYNGHVGIPAIASFSLGLYDWLTIGTHVKGHYFLKNNVIARLKTNREERGFLKLRTTGARESLGNIWSIGTMVKADHIARGLSLQLGYAYTAQDATKRDVFDTDTFSNSIVNTDEQFYSWSHHDIYASIEYDFAQDGQKWNPHIKFFYAQTLSGKRTFLNRSGGCNAGIYIILNF